MSSRVLGAIIGLAVYLLASSSYAQTTIDQALAVVLNDKTVGGNFQIQLRVKGTNLPAANTLGSATVDITYDNTKLTFVNSTVWSFGTSLGYTRSATNNTTFVRVLVTGSGVNEDGGGNPPGFDITGTYVTWVQLNFTIDDATGTTDLTIDGTSNAIGLFENYQNEPNTGVINDQPLSDPEELIAAGGAGAVPGCSGEGGGDAHLGYGKRGQQSRFRSAALGGRRQRLCADCQL